MYPELRLTPTVAISTYFLIISVACTLACIWFVRRAERRRLGRVVAIDFTLVVLIAGFLGARVLHIFFEEPAYYAEHPWAAFQVWNGGFVFLGGLVSSVIAALVFCQWRREPFWFWADTAALPASLAYALGRWGCLFNGCCYGRECELPWALTLEGVGRHPTPAYASLWEFCLLALLWRFEKRFKTTGVLFNVWIVGHAAGRVVMEAFRDDPRGPSIHGLSLGTWMSVILAAAALTNLAATAGARGGHPGRRG